MLIGAYGNQRVGQSNADAVGCELDYCRSRPGAVF